MQIIIDLPGLHLVMIANVFSVCMRTDKPAALAAFNRVFEAKAELSDNTAGCLRASLSLVWPSEVSPKTA